MAGSPGANDSSSGRRRHCFTGEVYTENGGKTPSGLNERKLDGAEMLVISAGYLPFLNRLFRILE
jgi:hypothetical protein